MKIQNSGEREDVCITYIHLLGLLYLLAFCALIGKLLNLRGFATTILVICTIGTFALIADIVYQQVVLIPETQCMMLEDLSPRVREMFGCE